VEVYGKGRRSSLLEELGETYDTEWTEHGDRMKGPDYLAVNPMGKVPTVTHKGKAVTEYAAICTYLGRQADELVGVGVLGLLDGSGYRRVTVYRGDSLRDKPSREASGEEKGQRIARSR